MHLRVSLTQYFSCLKHTIVSLCSSAHTQKHPMYTDPLSAFQPFIPSSRLSAYHKPRVGHRVAAKSHTFAYPKSPAFEPFSAALELKRLASVQEQTTAPRSSAIDEQSSGSIPAHRKTSGGELKLACSSEDPSHAEADRAILQQASLQRTPASAAPSLVIPSAQARPPERSILDDAESGDTDAQATVVRVLLSSFMKPETVFSGVPLPLPLSDIS